MLHTKQNEIDGRVDFRSQPTVTIDGETAKDFDDAVSIEKHENGHFRLWVHIADVSHYVPTDSALDREAFGRGTSVYFPDRSIPMLPEKLSNQLCSLNPGVDRLTLSVGMEVDGQGDLQSCEFYRSIIHSNERMTYTAVRKILIDRDEPLRKRYQDLLENLEWMLELSRILTARRLRKGAIDFDLPEAEVEYDVHGEIQGRLLFFHPTALSNQLAPELGEAGPTQPVVGPLVLHITGPHHHLAQAQAPSGQQRLSTVGDHQDLGGALPSGRDVTQERWGPAHVQALEDPPNSGNAEGEVVSLAGYRRQRDRRETGERRSELQNIYESQFLHEAERIASMLEYEGIPAHVLNRHNGSILIHPMAEMRFKVLVLLIDTEVARMFIEEDWEFASPEDSSIT